MVIYIITTTCLLLRVGEGFILCSFCSLLRTADLMVRIIFTSDLCVAILAGTVLPPEIGTARPPITNTDEYVGRK